MIQRWINTEQADSPVVNRDAFTRKIVLVRLQNAVVARVCFSGINMILIQWINTEQADSPANDEHTKYLHLRKDLDHVECLVLILTMILSR